MSNLGKHAVFIWGSYVIAFVILAVLIIWLVSTGRAYAARLDDFKTRGITRRNRNNNQVEK
ncbi:MAG: hypothetical protein TECD_00168 [Hyphomicrobiaceae bacterium hypho_1]